MTCLEFLLKRYIPKKNIIMVFKVIIMFKDNTDFKDEIDYLYELASSYQIDAFRDYIVANYDYI